MKRITECLGENLRRLRRERGLTQADLAARSGISIGFMQNIEAGRRWVGLDTVTALARALGVAEAELFRDPDSIASRPDPKAVMEMIGEALGYEASSESSEAE